MTGAGHDTQMGTPRLRAARPGDAAEIARVHVAAWRVTYANVLSADFLAALDVRQWADRWRERLAATEADASQLVLLEGERIIGFISVGRAQEPLLREFGELHAIYLEPAYIGRGLGALLHDAGLNALRAAGLRNAMLWVAASNTPARSFYQRKGWKANGMPAPKTVAGATILSQRYDRSLE